MYVHITVGKLAIKPEYKQHGVLVDEDFSIMSNALLVLLGMVPI